MSAHVSQAFSTLTVLIRKIYPIFLTTIFMTISSSSSSSSSIGRVLYIAINNISISTGR